MIRLRTFQDLPEVEALLTATDLPTEGLDRTQGWVLEEEGHVVGHVALESARDASVIRSLVVASALRAGGHGGRLLDVAERAVRRGPIVLKTDTIAPWVLRRGYRAVTLGDVPPGVYTTTQFEGGLCAGTPVFRKELSMATVHDTVQAAYGRIASAGSGCCGPASSSCCGGGADADSLAQALGYSADQLAAIPEGANLGLSCGNPTALAELQPGEVVLDLGSGAGFDVFIAAARVGAKGHVHGVDMTREMVAKARQNAAAFRRRTGLDNLTFHHANIELLPLETASVDAVISNCVLNLSPDQPQVWREIARVLRPGGRVSISDIVLLKPLPEAVKGQVEALVGCIAGASLLADVQQMMAAAGLTDLQVELHGHAFSAMLDPADPLHQQILADLPAGSTPGDYATSAILRGRRPTA